MDSTHETTAELFTSRPAPEERLEKELLCYDLLEKYKIPYTGLDHPAAMSVEDCHNADVLLGIHICKNLFFVQPAEDRLLSASDAGRQSI